MCLKNPCRCFASYTHAPFLMCEAISTEYVDGNCVVIWPC